MSVEEMTKQYIKKFNVFLRELGAIDLDIKTEYVWQDFNGAGGCEIKNMYAYINNKWQLFKLPPSDLVDEVCKDIYRINQIK